MAIHEIMRIDDRVRDMIMNSASASEITRYMKAQGMLFLLDDGLKKVEEGLTTTEEILRVAMME